MNKKPNVGGQAVIEGVMMRGKTHVAVAVRQPDGEISVDVRPVNSISDRYPILKKPFLRGVVSLVESLVMGMKALAYPAQVSGDEDEKLDSKEMALTIAVSAGLAILLFIVIPTWSMRFLTGITQDHMALNLAEGVLRMAIFLAYIAAISSMNGESGGRRLSQTAAAMFSLITARWRMWKTWMKSGIIPGRMWTPTIIPAWKPCAGDLTAMRSPVPGFSPKATTAFSTN